MARVKNKQLSRHQSIKGGGLFQSARTVVNEVIDALPIELDLPGGYQYCGPGTRLRERLARDDPGINKLDQACKTHGIAYTLFQDNVHRGLADQRLADSAWAPVKSADASIGERAASLAVATAMKVKA